jgi:membrane protein
MAVQQRYGKDSGGYLAAVVTYYGFLSLFPLILLGLAVVGFILAGSPAAQQEWQDALTETIPGLGPVIGRNIDAVVAARGPATVIGLVSLLWTGIGVVEASGWALAIVHRVQLYSNFVRKKVWSIGSLMLLGTLSLVSAALTTLAGGLQLPGPLDLLIVPVGGTIGFGLDFVLFLVGYRLLVQGQGPPFRELWPGALVTATAWFGLKFLGSWFASRTLESASAVYGTFAAVVAVLVLLYLAARVFVYGAELNVVLAERRKGNSVEEKHPEPRTEVSVSGNGRTKPPQEQSTAELIRSIAADTGILLRKEVDLARQEITEGVTAKTKAAGAMAAAGLLGLIAVVFLATAGAWALSLVMPNWAAWLIVGGVFVLLAGVAFLFGRARMKATPLAPEKTKQTVKEDVEWARAQLKR